LDGLFECFVKNDITDCDGLLDSGTLPFNKKILDAMGDIKKFIHSKKGKYSKEILPDMCIGLLDILKKCPDDVKENEDLAQLFELLSIVVESKSVQLGSKSSKRLAKKLKNIIPGGSKGKKMPDELRKLIDMAMKNPKKMQQLLKNHVK